MQSHQHTSEDVVRHMAETDADDERPGHNFHAMQLREVAERLKARSVPWQPSAGRRRQP